VLHRPSIEYPGSAMERGIQGTVTAEVTLDDAGNVSDARVVTGPPELRRVVLQSVLEWHFLPGAAGSVRQVSVTFDAAAAQKAAAEERSQEVTRLDRGSYTLSTSDGPRTLLQNHVELTAGGSELAERLSGSSEELRRLERQLEETRTKLEVSRLAPAAESVEESRAVVTTGFLQDEVRQLESRIAERQAELTSLSERASSPVMAVGHKLARIEATGFSDEVRQALLSRMPMRVGDTLSEQSIEQIASTLRSFDEHSEYKIGWKLVQIDGGDFALSISAPNAERWRLELIRK
jgi:TonB family protein